MMTQNISYKGYLNSKWWLMVIGTAISMVLASFYIYFGWEIYLTILAAGIYNIGFNSFLVLLTGAYTRTAIDLESAKGAFGDKKAFNVKTLLFSLPQLVLPILLFGLGILLNNINIGIGCIALFGILGLLFKTQLFSIIEKIYKKEKYNAIAAYKQKN
jgi:xanthosine utilization system XapX-like protein